MPRARAGAPRARGQRRCTGLPSMPTSAPERLAPAGPPSRSPSVLRPDAVERRSKTPSVRPRRPPEADAEGSGLRDGAEHADAEWHRRGAPGAHGGGEHA
ncbi:unnamed protein product, partial [Prorocentrum cordatum]